MLKGIEETSNDTIKMINRITEEMYNVKQEIRNNTKIYSKELLEALFYDFCTKQSYIQKQLDISDRTAQKYLDNLVDIGILTTEKIGRERIYKNERLFNIIKEWENN